MAVQGTESSVFLSCARYMRGSRGRGDVRCNAPRVAGYGGSRMMQGYTLRTWRMKESICTGCARQDYSVYTWVCTLWFGLVIGT